jgi:hypothetical protein
MVQSKSASQEFRSAARGFMGAAILLLVGIPSVPVVVPGYTPPDWVLPVTLGAGLICALLAVASSRLAT